MGLPVRIRFATLLGSILLSLLLAPTSGQAQGLTYTLSPSARWVEWDESVGIARDRFDGGAVGIGFGRYVGLTAFYHKADGLGTNSSQTGLLLNGAALGDQFVDVRQKGGAVSLFFGTGNIVPIVSGGGSIIEFTPESGEVSSQLSLDWGAGLRTVFGETITGEVMVESSNYRMDRYRLAPGYASDGSFPVDPQSNDVLKNISVRAGLGIQLGKRSLGGSDALDDAFAQRYQSPFSNFALAVEPLVGRLDFDASTGLERQNMVGVRAGFDFGSFFGLRGFYWSGTESDLTESAGMRAYGGEAQFALAAGPGLNPYLVTGAGQLEWDDDFGDDPAAVPADQTSLIVGAGVDFNFGPRIRATFAARDFILAGSDLSGTQDLQTASTPADLVHNWQYSAGLKLLVGPSGLRQNRPSEVNEDGTPRLLEREPVIDSVGVETDTVVVAAPAPVADTVAIRRDREMVVPIPDRGEIYIRFGEPSATPIITGAPQGTTGTGLSEEAIRRIIREEMEAARVSNAARDEADAEALRRIEERIDARVRRLEERQDDVVGAVAAAQPGESITVPVDRSVREVRPYAGFALGGQSQVLLGVSGDIGPLKAGSPVHIVPQVGFGFGEGPETLLLSMGLEYRLPVMFQESGLDLQPLVSLGPSLLRNDGFEIGITSFIGASAVLFRDRLGQGTKVFAGYQGADRFDGGRLIFGLRKDR